MIYLSRLTIRRTPSADALKSLINPVDDAARFDAHHRLIWTAFAGDPDAKRDFLWRDEGNGRFLVLSKRSPTPAELFEPPEVKAFSPSLRTGDKLSFLLRANATHTVKTSGKGKNGKPKRQHRDVVMEHLHAVERGKDRIAQRPALAQMAGEEWLTGVGERSGFSVDRARVDHYRVLHLAGPYRRNPRFGILDLQGEIEIKEPEIFLTRLLSGFGRAKAFGCGLMLIRRG
ncbi:MAG: type I-E CRISPR-associated protein Cas6/Cse3/CasE [Parvularcula sp.]